MLIPKPFFKTLCLLSAWIAVFHLAGQSFAPGTVLCLGADGHLGVEQAGADKNCAEVSPPQPHRAAPSSHVVLQSDDCCGPCADLFLPGELVSECPAGRLFAPGQQPLLARQNPAPAILQHARPSTDALHPPPANTLPPAHLRHTTVLLI